MFLSNTNKTAQYLTIAFALVVLFFVGGASTTYADTYPIYNPDTGTGGGTSDIASVNAASQADAARRGDAATPGTPSTPRGGSDDTADPGMFDKGIQDILWTIVNNFFGGLVGITGLLLNLSVTQFVSGFGEYFLERGVGGAVDLIWKAVRDIFNLTFIFALVYLGFKMILNSDDAGTRKWLANIIMAALLVNFSLFITKFIVDFSNILATQILKAFPTVPESGGDVADISGLFMQIFGVTSVWDGNWLNENPASGGDGAYLYIFGVAIIFLITAFVFAAGAVMLFMRFIALSLYMVFSPLMFLGWVLPQFQGVTNKYWSGFLGRAFYAPAYVLLLYFSAMILAALPKGGSLSGSLQKGSTQIGSIEGILAVFAIGAMFMIASVVVAGKMSVDGSGAAIKMMQNVRGRVQRGVQNAAYGTGRFAVRNTAGYGAQAVSYGAEGARRRLDRSLASMGQRGAVSRFAARTVDRTLGAGLRATEGASLAGSETAAQQRKRVAEQQTRFNQTAKETKRVKDYETHRSEIDKQQALLDDTTVQGIDRQRAETLKANAEAALGAVIKEMSADELQNLSQATGGFLRDETSGRPLTNAEVLSDELVAKHLTPEQMKALGSSGKYNNEQMKTMGKARTSGIFNDIETALQDTSATAEELTDNFDKLSETVQKLSDEETVKLGVDNLSKTTIAANLTQRQLDAISNSGKFTQAEIAQIKTARETGLNQIATSGSLHVERTDPITGRTATGAVQPALDPSKSTSLAEQRREFYTNQRKKLFEKKAGQTDPLPISIFTDQSMVEYLTPRALEQRIKDGYISDTDMKTIKDNIENYATTPQSDPNAELRRQAAYRIWKKWSNSQNNVIAAQTNLNIP